MRWWACVFGGWIVVACSGAPQTELQGIPEESSDAARDPSKPGTSPPPGDAGMLDAMVGVLDSSMPPPPPPDSGPPPPTCSELRNAVDTLVLAAEACVTMPNVCAQMIPGPCCPLTVTDPNSVAAQQLSTAMAAYKKACGGFQCGKEDCRKSPSKTCDKGRCKQN